MFRVDCIIFCIQCWCFCQIITARSKQKHRWQSSSSSVLAAATVTMETSISTIRLQLHHCLSEISCNGECDDLFLYYCFLEMQHCITVSAMDALQWMGAVRMRVQTSDKNITIIHTTPVHQLTSGEDKSWNKSSIKMFLTKIWVHNP